ncbi:HAMP domain-containing sensor histidine kinase [Halobacteriovorax sp. HLS]|uniref:sensor histidine kinase n=1 Tax=Halobacteriovorax sp. HLS TaxID=2234000 RepID=UPI000FDA4C22|nr:HAMP domain-containing sensor histidine kinase [Halobacteriovorax sp. HLS]
MNLSPLKLKQLKHDIASPLAAIKTVTNLNGNLGLTEKKLLEASVKRVEALIESLKPTEELYKGTNIYSCVNEIVNEKSMTLQRKNLKLITKFDMQSKEAICLIQSTEFKRVLSNLMNNSIDALDNQENKGLIKLKAKVENSNLYLSIIDNGHGISKEYVNQVTNLGWSHRKDHGQGLGLFHAKKSIENWNGQLKINSVFNLGTKVTVIIPIEPFKLSIAA